MKIRNRNPTADKIESQMTPMIDVVFLLLIFFMFTLKIIEPEGDFNINMPLSRPAEAAVTDAELPPLKVRLEADPGTGDLRSLRFGDRDLGGGPDAFRTLNEEINRIVLALQNVGPADAEDGAETQEVELDPDFNLDYRYVISAISACSGRVTAEGTTVPLLSRIKFAQVRQEEPLPVTEQ
ncbi:MAG: biopolymer transporter ExbD [Fuerstiella sp.]|nr:biopolymer transporter ExbD [Fuerstiella sp.]